MSFDCSMTSTDEARAEQKLLRRQQYYRAKLESLPTDADVRQFQSLVQTNAAMFGRENQTVITYWNFLYVKGESSKALQSMLTSEMFSADQGTDGAIALCDVGLLFDVVDTRITMTKYFLLLSVYDGDGDGYITPEEFYSFYLDNVAVKFPQLQKFMEDVVEEKSCVVYSVITSKLITFLDKSHSGRISIKDILGSGIITEIDSLVNGLTVYDYCNWFSPENIIYLTEEFRQLNETEDGVLTIDQFMKYQPNIKNKRFLEKIFELLNTDGIMDLGYWSKFLLILRYKANPVSLKYIFYGLDSDSDGLLSLQDIQDHFEEMCFIAMLNDRNAVVPPDFDNFLAEIYDMLNVDRRKQGISLQDWLNGPYVHAVAVKLINSSSFSMHEFEEDRVQFLEGDVDTFPVVAAADALEEEQQQCGRGEEQEAAGGDSLE